MIIVTGASSGIGKYLIEKFSNSTEIVYGTYHTNELKGLIHMDVREENHISDFVQMLNLGHSFSNSMVTLINCVGINYDSFAHKADIWKWTNVINVNLVGVFNIIRAFLPHMRLVKWGRIINISSVVAQRGVMGTSAYAASKAGLWGMTKAIAVENASLGITINNINAGYFDAGMTHDIPNHLLKGFIDGIPMKKLGDPYNILNTVLYLVKSDYITGTSIDINGGLV